MSWNASKGHVKTKFTKTPNVGHMKTKFTKTPNVGDTAYIEYASTIILVEIIGINHRDDRMLVSVIGSDRYVSGTLIHTYSTKCYVKDDGSNCSEAIPSKKWWQFWK